jgi:tetratricopeptide (TPR) repeat protein
VTSYDKSAGFILRKQKKAPAAAPHEGKTLKLLLIPAVCFACYANTIANDYAYDDAVAITENKFTQKGIGGIVDIFRHNTFAGSYQDAPVLERYRPLSLATFAVERDVFGSNPHVSHFINVLLFALSAWVLYVLLKRLFPAPPGAAGFLDVPFLAALLFAVHPVHTEIVANIKGRDEILVLAGSLSATLLVLKYLDGGKLRHWVASLCLFSLAVFSKENAITFLAVVPLTIFYDKRGRWVDALRGVAPLAVASGIFLLARGLALGESGRPAPADILTEPFAYASAAQRIATAFYTLGAYIRLLLFPHPLTIDYYPYHVRVMGWTDIRVWLSVVGHVALAGYALIGLKKRSVVAYGISIYLVTLSIVSNLPFSVGTFMSERFVFVPSVGFAIVAARVLAMPPAAYRKAVVFVLAIALAGKTYARNQVWKDDFTLLTTDAKTSEDSIKANLAAAVTLLLEADKPGSRCSIAECRTRALGHAQKAAELYRSHVDPAHLKGTSYQHVILLLGSAYQANGMAEDALRCYQELIPVATDRASLYETIAATINQSDDVEFRVRSYQEFVKLAPDSFSFNYHLGLLYGKDKNDLGRAVLYFKRAVDIAPKDVNALRGLAHAYTLAKAFDKAAFYFEQLVEADPENPVLLTSLYRLYVDGGNQAKADEVRRRIEAVRPRRGLE